MGAYTTPHGASLKAHEKKWGFSVLEAVACPCPGSSC